MVTTKTYISNVVTLVKSLLIKSADTAIHINNELVRKYGYNILGDDPDNKYTWKYFLNMSGEYHDLDTPIKITIIEDNTVKEFTKATLDQYPYTRKELLLFGTYYKTLVSLYPEQELLIKGILYDTNINDIINSEEGTIVAYNSNFIEEQELDLIVELSKYSSRYFLRWHIREYGVVDNLYIPTLLATLYTKLVLKVLNIRLGNIFTYKAHSFHVNHFFKSHFKLDIDVNTLSKESKLWLYKNLRYLAKHIGSNRTLDLLIEHILTNNGVGIADVDLINKLPPVDLTNAYDATKALYDTKIDEINTSKRNKYYFYNSNRTMTPDDFILLELNDKYVDNDLIIKNTDFYKDVFENKTLQTTINNQKTKVLKLKAMVDNIVTESITFKFLLDNLIYHTYINDYNESFTFIDDNTTRTYTISSKQAILIIFKLLLDKADIDNPYIEAYSYNEVINNTVTHDTINDNLVNGFLGENLSDKILSTLPRETYFANNRRFNDYLTSLNGFNSLLNIIKVNSMDLFLNATMDVITDRVHLSGEFIFDNNLNDMLAYENIDLAINDGYDHVATISKILEYFTGYGIESNSLYKMVDDHISIIKKLSSYTIQFVNETLSGTDINVKYNTIVSNSTTGIVDIHCGMYAMLEDFYGVLKLSDAPFGTYILADVDDVPIKAYLNNQPLTLHAYVTDTVDGLQSISFEHTMPEVSFINDCFIDLYSPNFDINDKYRDTSLIGINDGVTYDGVIEDEVRSFVMYGDDEIEAISTPNLIANTSSSFRVYSPNMSSIATIDESSTLTDLDNFVPTLSYIASDLPDVVVYTNDEDITANTQPTVIATTNKK